MCGVLEISGDATEDEVNYVIESSLVGHIIIQIPIQYLASLTRSSLDLADSRDTPAHAQPDPDCSLQFLGIDESGRNLMQECQIKLEYR